jgi:hypothetical protein
LTKHVVTPFAMERYALAWGAVLWPVGQKPALGMH